MTRLMTNRRRTTHVLEADYDAAVTLFAKNTLTESTAAIGLSSNGCRAAFRLAEIREPVCAPAR
jgi:hypothetical protein